MHHNTPEPKRSGHYKKGITREHREPAEVLVESRSAKVARLLTRHTDLCDEARQQQGTDWIPSIAAELDAVEAQIRALGFRPPTRSYRVT